MPKPALRSLILSRRNDASLHLKIISGSFLSCMVIASWHLKNETERHGFDSERVALVDL